MHLWVHWLFKKEIKSLLKVFFKASHACICVYAYSQWAEPLPSHMAALQSLSSTVRLQKKISVFNPQFVSSHSTGHKHQQLQLIQTQWIPFQLKGLKSAWMYAYIHSSLFSKASQTASCTLAINAVKRMKLLGLHLKRKRHDGSYLRAGIFIQKLMQCFWIFNKQTSKDMRITSKSWLGTS